jgi:transmembrane sensor
MSKSRLAFLFQAYFDKTATPAEREELMELLQQTENNEQLRNLLTTTWQQYTSNNQPFSESEGDEMLAAILQQGRLSKPVAVMAPQPAKRRWRMLAAAATVLLFMGAGGYFWFTNKQAAPVATTLPPVNDSIVPGGNKALLTLADGRQIVLDSAGNGNIAQQENVAITKQGAQIVYNASGARLSTVDSRLNIVTTPRGGQYKLQLADGTKVWLNASSSITFPVAFHGHERHVTVTGEVYFEVAHVESRNGTGAGKRMPFIVNVNNKADVMVLGTHFNINAYDDEESIRTTLLEGKVKVSATGSQLSTIDSRLLSPGYQAKIKPSGEIKTGQADIEEVMAWKNGWFQFNGHDIESIMRQVSRWYDVDIVYQGKIPTGHYSGIVSRENNIEQVLRIMQAGGVGFTIAGHKVTVFEEHH